MSDVRCWRAVVLLFAVAAGCTRLELETCRSDDDCAAGAVCTEGFCIGEPVPQAMLVVDRNAARLGETVRLDARSSSDPRGAELTFTWRLEPADAGRLAEAEPGLALLELSKPHVEMDVVVEVSNGAQASEAVAHVVVANAAPVVTLRTEPEVAEPGEQVLLMADATDADGDPLSFNWSLDGEAGSLELDGARATLRTEETAEMRYRVRVGVSDGQPDGDREASVELSPENLPPRIRLPSLEPVEHRCEGNPLHCSATAALPVEVTDMSPVTVTWRKISEGPVTASFVPGDEAATEVTLACEPACPIAGTHVLEITATDEGGSAATAQLEVEVGNRPPIVRAHDGSPLAHALLVAALDPLESTFRATRAPGSIVTWEDPDGDPPLPGSVIWSGSPQGVFEFSDVSAIDPEVVVAGTSADLRDLEVAVQAADLNGAQAADRQSLPILNRPPTVTFGGDTRTGHEYVGPGAYRKRISLASLVVEDPDGDEPALVLTLDPFDDEGISRGASIRRIGEDWYLEGDDGFLDYTYRVVATVTDGWGESASSTGGVLVSNRPPVLLDSVGSYQLLGARVCEMQSCCALSGPTGCSQVLSGVVTTRNGPVGTPSGPARNVWTLRVEDLDGDPVSVEVTESSATNASPRLKTGASSWSALPRQRDCGDPSGTVSSCTVELALHGEVESGALSCSLSGGTSLDAQARLIATAVDAAGARSSGDPFTFEVMVDPTDGSCL